MKKAKGTIHKKRTAATKCNSLTVKFDDNELKVLCGRAKSMGLSKAEYLRVRGLKPLGRLRESQKKEGDRIIITREVYEACLKIHAELQIQGRNINQIARAVNSIRLTGGEVPDYSATLDRIRTANLEIGQSIARLGGR